MMRDMTSSNPSHTAMGMCFACAFASVCLLNGSLGILFILGIVVCLSLLALVRLVPRAS